MAGKQMSFADMVDAAMQGPPKPPKRSSPTLAKGSTPNPSPPRQETNPRTPLVDPIPEGDLEGPRQNTKRRRADAGVSDMVVNLSDGVSGQSKKKKPGKDSRGKSPKLRLEKLSVADYDRYREDPLEAAADVCKAASKLLKKFKREEEERFAGLKVERDEALGQAKEARDALEEAEVKVNNLRSSEAKMKKDLEEMKLAKEAAEAKMKEELQEMKIAKEAADRKLEEFEG